MRELISDVASCGTARLVHRQVCAQPAGSQIPHPLGAQFPPWTCAHRKLFPETCHKKRCRPVYSFSTAALTNFHKLGGLYNKDSKASHGAKIKVFAGLRSFWSS